MASFLEDHVRPRVNEMRSAYMREYAEIYHEWASSLLVRSGDDAPAKCLQFVEIADRHQREIASRYPRRFLVQAIRTIPLRVVRLMSQGLDDQTLLDVIRLATKCAVISANRVRDDMICTEEGQHSLLVTPEELQNITEDLAGYLARFLGATYARIVGSQAFRSAGKGGRLRDPTPVSEDVWAIFDKREINGIIIVPCPVFERNEGLGRSIAEYDERRRRAQVMGSSGLAFAPHRLDSGGTGWLTVGIVGEAYSDQAVEIYFPRPDLTITSDSYLVLPEGQASRYRTLSAFADLFPDRLGVSYEAFRCGCEAVAALVMEQTGLRHIDEPTLTSSGLRFQCMAPLTNENAFKAAGFIYELFARAALRGPRASYVDHISRALAANGIPEARVVAETFIGRFTWPSKVDASLDDPLNPALFFAVDPKTLMLDVLLMQEFFENCLRTLTCGDGEPANRRAATFEQQCRDTLTDLLCLRPEDVPFPPNQNVVVLGKNYGDVDFDFVRNGILINLEMKSWQRSTKYFRGDPNAIANRINVITAQLMDKAEPRGLALLNFLKAKGLNLRGVITLACVASVEYVPPSPHPLRYGKVPRVLIAEEIAEIVNDRDRLEELFVLTQESMHGTGAE